MDVAKFFDFQAEYRLPLSGCSSRCFEYRNHFRYETAKGNPDEWQVPNVWKARVDLLQARLISAA